MKKSFSPKGAISKSIELVESAGLFDALKVLDNAIEDAVSQHSKRSVQTLCHHAAILCDSSRNRPLRRHYYELSLLHDPGNYRAFYGLATISLEEGKTEMARQFAEKSYRAILATDDPIARLWLDTIELNWPHLKQTNPPRK